MDRRRAASDSGDDLIDWFTVTYRTICARRRRARAAGCRPRGSYYWTRTTPAAAAPSPPRVRDHRALHAHRGQREGEARSGRSSGCTATKAVILRKNDLVRTGAGSAAEIHFFDGTVVPRAAGQPDHDRGELARTRSTQAAQGGARTSQSGEVNFDAPRSNVPGQRDRDLDADRAHDRRERETAGGIQVAESGESDVKLFRGQRGGQDQGRPEDPARLERGLNVDAAGKAGADREPAATCPRCSRRRTRPRSRTRTRARDHAAGLEAACPARPPTT